MNILLDQYVEYDRNMQNDLCLSVELRFSIMFLSAP